MNIYAKLAKARAAFHQLNLKKSGMNTYQGYSYFELSDFLIPGMKCLEEQGLCPVISFGVELAEMTIHDMEKMDDDTTPNFITITSPMSESHMKGAQPIQNLGSVQTYLRRYLWMAALEIVEHDAIDSAEQIKSLPPQPLATPSQWTVIQAFIKDGAVDDDQKKWLTTNKDNLTQTNADEIIKKLRAKDKENAK